MNQQPIQPILSQNEAKYKNMRVSLLLVVVFSFVNIFSILFIDRYYVFSAYIPQIIMLIGQAQYLETGIVAFNVISAVFSVILTVPYLLCYIFSKKHYGWMIGALALFSVDSLLFLVDFISYMALGEFSMILDFAIRAYVLVSLIMGVKYGVNAHKERAEASEKPATDDFFQFDEASDAAQADPLDLGTREITVIRKKAFAGMAIPFSCYVNGQLVCTLKNGESATFTAPAGELQLSATIQNGMAVGNVQVPEGNDPLCYQLSIKMGMIANTLEFSLLPTAQDTDTNS